jgi:hypothetical protein
MIRSRAIFSTEDFNIVKSLIIYSLQHNPNLDDRTRKKLDNLYHRLGRADG